MTSDAPPLAPPQARRERDAKRLEQVRRVPDLSARSIATRAAAVVLWLIVCSSAASGFLALARVRAVEAGRPAGLAAENTREAGPARMAETAAEGAGPVEGAGPAEGAGVEGFAELYVAAYLEGAQQAVRTFYPEAPALDAVREGDRYVARAAAVRVRATGQDAWAVTVGVEVLVAAEGGYRRDGIHYFDVEVARSGDAYAATSLPSEVWGPTGR
jgi:hypothetical protein